MTRPLIDHSVREHTGVTEVTEPDLKISLHTNEAFCCPRFQAAQQGARYNYSCLFNVMTALCDACLFTVAEKRTLR